MQTSRTFGRARLTLERGDITRHAADALVNAANSTLLGGGGVDGAIHRAGGPSILEECRRLGGCEPGDAKATGAGRLPARHVIHAVGPVWRGGDQGEDDFLASCYRTSLELADALACTSVAFPAISTGAYGFPVERAARIALGTIARHLLGTSGLERVTMVLHSAEDLDEHARALAGLDG